ncbi:CTQ-dependent glycine oxidase GoxA [Fodinicurvata sediminis]|uniref:CTQ-dependent glycine oxidase GoxA n=1 Tax=Fodinicurvata sediminis TaxID=1121832 RepID=UPI0003B566FD|nr:CTQ-dependent glycine oxidase GoxA [Fodinicurvata sediminis]
MNPSDKGPTLRRRDFLATGTAFMAGLPLLPKASVAALPSLEPAPEGARIARLGVYPAIGISRVGGSPEWYLAPEVPGLPPQPEGGFKDGTRLIKKQVQRFRIYAFDDKGRVIGEVTEGKASIRWNVHVANTKAAWYGFSNPLDNDDLAPGLPGEKRNSHFVSAEERARMLVIDGGPTTISGKDTNAEGSDPDFAMWGRFHDRTNVGFGQLRTDAEGRLLVLPPDGISDSPVGSPITSFADNDGSYDDWCDGPVRAEVTLADGRTLNADPGWVACVGPNFAPEIPPITTLHDVISDLNVSEGWQEAPVLPLSFRKHIYPIFRRLALMEWVSEAAFLRQGWLEIGDFSDPAYIERLADPGPYNESFRREVFAKFRDPNNDSDTAYRDERLKLPFMLGDGINYNGSPLQWFRFPKLQYAFLEHWAAGDFTNDLEDATADAIDSLNQVPLTQQPAALSEAALENCSGGAFHPGVELTYYLRLAPLYARAHDPKAEPFRLALGQRDSLLQDVGRLLTPEAAFQGGNGAPAPIGPQMPGDLTRWMGLPWQCDAFSCQDVLMQDDFPTAVWWPALLPVDVLPEDHYDALMRADLPADQRRRFYENRVPWSRGVAGIGYHANASYWDGITNMIALWQRMGFIVKRPGPSDPERPDAIPQDLFVEVGRDNMEIRFDWTEDKGPLPR